MDGDNEQEQEPLVDLAALQQEQARLQKMIDNFKIVGPGISGNFETGFVYNPEEI
jgi:hypothetical protein